MKQSYALRHTRSRERLKRILFLALALVLAPATWGTELHAKAITVTDDQGRSITLDKPAGRIIALYGAFNEILDGLGRTSAIVARTNADKLPAGIEKLPVIGTHMRPNIEAVLAQRPDLVLQFDGRKEASLPVEALRKHGVRVAVFRASTFAELFSVIRRVGTLTASEAQAEEMVRGMQARLDALDNRLMKAKRPRVFFEVRSPSMLAAGSSGLVAEIIHHAGGLNCIEAPDKFARLNEEEIVRLNPEVYLIQRGPMNPAPLPLSKRPRLSGLAAAKSGRVWFVDEQKYSRPSPLSIDAAEELAGLLHPELAAPAPKQGMNPKKTMNKDKK